MTDEVAFGLQLKVANKLLEVEILHGDDSQSVVDRMVRTSAISQEYREVVSEKLTTCLQRMLTPDLAAPLFDKIMRFLMKGKVPDEPADYARKTRFNYESIGSQWKSSLDSITQKKDFGEPLKAYNTNIPKNWAPEAKNVQSAEVSREVSRYRPQNITPDLFEQPVRPRPNPEFEPKLKENIGYETRPKQNTIHKEPAHHLQSGTYRQLEHIPEMSDLEELSHRPQQRRPNAYHVPSASSSKPASSERPRGTLANKTNQTNQTTFIRPNKAGYLDYKPQATQKNNYREIVGQRYSRTARTMPHHTRPEPSSKLQLASRQANILMGSEVGSKNPTKATDERPQYPMKRHTSTQKYEKKALTNPIDAYTRPKSSSSSVAVMRRFKYLNENDYQSYYL